MSDILEQYNEKNEILEKIRALDRTYADTKATYIKKYLTNVEDILEQTVGALENSDDIASNMKSDMSSIVSSVLYSTSEDASDFESEQEQLIVARKTKDASREVVEKQLYKKIQEDAAEQEQARKKKEEEILSKLFKDNDVAEKAVVSSYNKKFNAAKKTYDDKKASVDKYAAAFVADKKQKTTQQLLDYSIKHRDIHQDTIDFYANDNTYRSERLRLSTDVYNNHTENVSNNAAVSEKKKEEISMANKKKIAEITNWKNTGTRTYNSKKNKHGELVKTYENNVETHRKKLITEATNKAEAERLQKIAKEKERVEKLAREAAQKSKEKSSEIMEKYSTQLAELSTKATTSINATTTASDKIINDYETEGKSLKDLIQIHENSIKIETEKYNKEINKINILNTVRNEKITMIKKILEEFKQEKSIQQKDRDTHTATLNKMTSSLNTNIKNDDNKSKTVKNTFNTNTTALSNKITAENKIREKAEKDRIAKIKDAELAAVENLKGIFKSKLAEFKKTNDDATTKNKNERTKQLEIYDTQKKNADSKYKERTIDVNIFQYKLSAESKKITAYENHEKNMKKYDIDMKKEINKNSTLSKTKKDDLIKKINSDKKTEDDSISSNFKTSNKNIDTYNNKLKESVEKKETERTNLFNNFAKSIVTDRQREVDELLTERKKNADDITNKINKAQLEYDNAKKNTRMTQIGALDLDESFYMKDYELNGEISAINSGYHKNVRDVYIKQINKIKKKVELTTKMKNTAIATEANAQKQNTINIETTEAGKQKRKQLHAAKINEFKRKRDAVAGDIVAKLIKDNNDRIENARAVLTNEVNSIKSEYSGVRKTLVEQLEESSDNEDLDAYIASESKKLKANYNKNIANIKSLFNDAVMLSNNKAQRDAEKNGVVLPLPSTGPPPGPGRGPLPGPSTGPSTGPPSGPSTGPPSGPGRGPSAPPSTGPSTGPPPGPGRGPASTGPGRGPASTGPGRGP